MTLGSITLVFIPQVQRIELGNFNLGRLIEIEILYPTILVDHGIFSLSFFFLFIYMEVVFLFFFFLSRNKQNDILIETKVQRKEEISFLQKNIQPEQEIKPLFYKEYLQDPCYPIS